MKKALGFLITIGLFMLLALPAFAVSNEYYDLDINSADNKVVENDILNPGAPVAEQVKDTVNYLPVNTVITFTPKKANTRLYIEYADANGNGGLGALYKDGTLHMPDPLAGERLEKVEVGHAYKFTLAKDNMLYYVTPEVDDASLDFEKFYVRTGKVPTPDPIIDLPVTAAATDAKVMVNGKATAFEAYSINDNNYFKLRDIASVVSGTGKQFEVSWDEAKNAINLLSAKAYTPVGGELAKGDGVAKKATISTAVIYKDGQAIQLTAYTINNNNYFKLRDLCKAFDIGVTFDLQTNTVGIDTAISYVEETK